MKVQLAQHDMRVAPGNVYVAPGDYHMSVFGRGRIVKLHIKDTGRVNGHMPAVDPLFHSMATNFGSRSVAALMTGMGADGAEGLLALRNAGALTIAQNEATSVVWGMPGEAVKRGAACEVTPLERMSRAILRLVRKQSEEARAAG